MFCNLVPKSTGAPALIGPPAPVPVSVVAVGDLRGRASSESNKFNSCKRAGGLRGEGGASGARSNRPISGLWRRSARETRRECWPCAPVAAGEEDADSDEREVFRPEPPARCCLLSSMARMNSDRSSSFSVGSRSVLCR